MVDFKPTRVIGFAAVKQCTQKFFCYGWFRDGQCLYIGRTIQGFHRFFPHHVINTKLKVDDTDEFHFWDVKDELDVIQLEKNLIGALKPLFNHNVATYEPILTLCLVCKQQFVKRRDWQRFCSVSCRNQAYKEHREQVNRMITINCRVCKKEFQTTDAERKIMTIYCPECFLMTDEGVIYRRKMALTGEHLICKACQTPFFQLAGTINEKQVCPPCAELLK
jgi:hypothetical protein